MERRAFFERKWNLIIKMLSYANKCQYQNQYELGTNGDISPACLHIHAALQHQAFCRFRWIYFNFARDRNWQMELFCSTSRRNHLNKWWKFDHSCWDYWQTRPGWCLNLSLGGRWTSPSAWPDPVSLARTHTSIPGCSLAAAGLHRVYRLSYSLQLCTLLPPTGNIREANLLSREDVEFLVVEIRHLQAEDISRDGGFSVDKILSYCDCHPHPATGKLEDLMQTGWSIIGGLFLLFTCALR